LTGKFIQEFYSLRSAGDSRKVLKNSRRDLCEGVKFDFEKFYKEPSDLFLSIFIKDMAEKIVSGVKNETIHIYEN
jgi:hypothetical protein